MQQLGMGQAIHQALREEMMRDARVFIAGEGVGVSIHDNPMLPTAGLLKEFGDAEIASPVAPRHLTIEHCRVPPVEGPPAVPPGRVGGAAPGRLRTPTAGAVAAEVSRFRGLTQGKFECVSVCSSVPVNGYTSFSGTSMASPHASGVAALLWSARHQLKNRIGLSRCILSRSADPAVSPTYVTECGGTTAATRPNNLFGWGLASAWDAIHLGPDADADGIPDACDCAPADGGAYDLPGEVGGIRFDTGPDIISWNSLALEAGPGIVYDLLRGDLADLRDLGTIEDASCLAGGTSANSFEDLDLPLADGAFYYLVQARNGCGAGGWGSNSSGTARVHESCP